CGDVVDGDTVDADNAIAGHDAACGDLDADEPGPVRRRARRHAQYEYALTAGQRLQTRVELLIHLDAQRRTDVLAGLYELRHHAHAGLDRHRKADAGRGARRTVDGGIDADQPPSRIEQRATGIAGVDSGVGLDQVVNGRATGVAGKGAVKRRDDAGGERPVEPEGIANGKDLLPHLEIGTGAHRHRRRAFEADADLEYGDVVRWARPHQRGLVVAAVGKLDGGFGRALDDVEVGDDMAGVVPNEARSRATGHGEDIARPDVAHQLRGGDVDHRGA